jgi:hypothetical protein
MVNQIVKPHIPSLKLWYYILRKIRLLPQNTQIYYRNYAIQHFWTFRNEEDPERVNEIVTKSHDNVKWVCKKFNIPID